MISEYFKVINDYTFEEAWEKCSLLTSAVFYDEAELLFKYAKKTKDETIIMEIGAHLGRSTVLLAHCSRTVNTIDPLIPGHYPDPYNGMACDIYPEDAAKLALIFERYSNIHWIRKKREDVQKLEFMSPIGFIFIDADHTYPNPKLDFLHFIDEYVPGSYQAWHDYGTFRGVSISVEELVEDDIIEIVEQKGTLLVTRLKNG